MSQYVGSAWSCVPTLALHGGVYQHRGIYQYIQTMVVQYLFFVLNRGSGSQHQLAYCTAASALGELQRHRWYVAGQGVHQSITIVLANRLHGSRETHNGIVVPSSSECA